MSVEGSGAGESAGNQSLGAGDAAERAAIRERSRAKIKALDPAERLRAGAAVARWLEQSGWIAADRTVGGFWSLPTEVPMLVAQMLVERTGAAYHLPVLQPGSQLAFARFRAGDSVRPNRFGIPEPESINPLLAPRQLDVVLVPLTAFDRRGNRLGSGGGWYDRSFAFRRQTQSTTPRLIGVAFACQEQPTLPFADWDVPLDAIITEREWISCSPNPAPP